MEFEVVNKNLIWTSVGYGNSSAINLGNYIVVIDSMFNWELAREWRKIIETHFGKKISAFFLTHHHADHCFGNQVFSDVPIISSTSVRNIMKSMEKEHWTSKNLVYYKQDGYGIDGLKITHPTVCFDKNLTLNGEDMFLEITCLDGHTKGSSILWEPQSRILIAGDLVFNHQYPNGGDPTTNLPEWIEAIEFLIKLDPKIIISGHGPLATLEDLKEIKNFLSLTNDFINKGIKDGLTSDEIANSSDFPDYYGKEREERRKLSLQNWTEIVQKPNQK